MRRTLFAVAFLWTASLSAQSEAVKKAPNTSTLSRAEKTVLNYLAKDWEKEYRTTSIPVAAEATKVKLSDASRLRLAKFIEANRMSYRAPARHRTTTIALSPTEKLIARSILLLEAQGNEAARPDEIAKMMNASAPSLRGPLSFLQQFGAILPQASGGYRVDAKYPRKPSRFIDFFSHHVKVNGREQFEVA